MDVQQNVALEIKELESGKDYMFNMDGIINLDGKLKLEPTLVNAVLDGNLIICVVNLNLDLQPQNQQVSVSIGKGDQAIYKITGNSNWPSS